MLNFGNFDVVEPSSRIPLIVTATVCSVVLLYAVFKVKITVLESSCNSALAVEEVNVVLSKE